MAKKFPIKGRWLITGASSGIGAELANALQQRGCKVIGVGRRPAADVNWTLRGGDYFQADFSNPAQAVCDIKKHLETQNITHLDGVIQNAGLGRFGSPFDETMKDLDDITKVNLIAPILLSSALFPFLEKASGVMAFIGSVVVGKSAPDYASYAASKEALSGFSRSLRLEWEGRVRVIILHPGATKTGMHERAGFDPGLFGAVMASAETAAHQLLSGVENDHDGGRISLFGKLSPDKFSKAAS